MKRLAIYMFFDPEGRVGDYIPYKLQKLREHVETIVVVCNGALNDEGRRRLEAVADVVHVRENVGFDVWAYREAILQVVGLDRLRTYDELILLNYTFYGPIFPFGEMFGKLDAQPVDFWGITAYDGPSPNEFTGKGVLEFHIQSHWIAVRRRLLESDAFAAYWRDMPMITDYKHSVLRHEARFTKHFSDLGFSFHVYVEPKKYPVLHPVFDAIDLVLEDRCPILKRRPFFHDPLYLERNVIDLARALKIIERTSDYDLGLVWSDIPRFSKPRDLYTNASLLEVLPVDEPAPPLPRTPKVAVLAHVYFPALLPELLSHAAKVCVPYELHITTASEDKRLAIEAQLGELKAMAGFANATVRVVQNRGRDVSAHFVGLRDVVSSGAYDYICRLHSKVSPQDKLGMQRHFKNHLYENLLASRHYTARLLHMFERDPRLGMILPPIIHQGYPTLGHAWFTNRPGAEAWAKTLGIRVPFDDSTPLAAYGSMYWYRPEALRLLFAHPFRYEDFPEEPHYGDGGLPHILERLVVYACHANGYYSRSVLTPENAAKNYVKLEYRLQRLIAENEAVNQARGLRRVVHKGRELRDYMKETLRSHPKTYAMARAGFRTLKTTVEAARDMSQRMRRGER